MSYGSMEPRGIDEEKEATTRLEEQESELLLESVSRIEMAQAVQQTIRETKRDAGVAAA